MSATAKLPNPESKPGKHEAGSLDDKRNAIARAGEALQKTVPVNKTPPAGWGALLSPKNLAIAAALVIAANAAAFFLLRGHAPAVKPKRNLELVLGEFEFNRMNPRDKQIKHGQILVTLHLPANLDAAKLREVHDQEQSLQGAVEDAMKRTRASDYADPRFTRLRNRLLEHLNEALGFEGIEEVAIANVPDQPATNQASGDSQQGDAQSAAGNGDTPSQSTAAAQAEPPESDAPLSAGRQ